MEYYSDLLRSKGFRCNHDGLARLLGAPIGTREFQTRSVAAGGHLAIMTTDAIKFVAKVGQVRHTQAQYHLLRWSACTLLLHLGRLVSPHILSAYAMQFSTAIEQVATNMLAAESLTPIQLNMVRLPTKHSGLGLGGPLDTMHQAYVASSGAVARFYDTERSWYDRRKLLRQITASQHIFSAVSMVNDDLR